MIFIDVIVELFNIVVVGCVVLWLFKFEFNFFKLIVSFSFLGVLVIFGAFRS